MWNNIPREEQETVVNFDYSDKTIHLFTTRYSVANRLARRIGEPNKTNYSNNKIDSVEYKMSMGDNRVRKLLSMSALIIKPTKENDENE